MNTQGIQPSIWLQGSGLLIGSRPPTVGCQWLAARWPAGDLAFGVPGRHTKLLPCGVLLKYNHQPAHLRPLAPPRLGETAHMSNASPFTPIFEQVGQLSRRILHFPLGRGLSERSCRPHRKDSFSLSRWLLSRETEFWKTARTEPSCLTVSVLRGGQQLAA